MQRLKKLSFINRFWLFVFCFLASCLLFSGCGGGGKGGGQQPPTLTTGTISGKITLPANTSAKIFKIKQPFYAKILSSIAYAGPITDLATLIVKVGNTTTNPDTQGNYTITVTAGTNIEITVTAPSGNVVLSAMLPQLTAGQTVAQAIDTTTTAVALIYKKDTSLSISQIQSATDVVTTVKTAIETALTDVTDDSILTNTAVTSKVTEVATNIKNNHSPVISSLVANPTSVNTGGTSTITCTATDADNDTLTYAWTKTGGTITGSGSSVTYTAPSTAGTYTITVTVTDGKGGIVTKTADITVIAISGFLNLSNFPTKGRWYYGGSHYISGVGSTPWDSDWTFPKTGWTIDASGVKYNDGFVALKFPADVGNTWITVASSEGTDYITADLKANPLSFNVKIVSKESVTVKTGTYEALKVEYTYSKKEGFYTETMTVYSWYAPNVGLIKTTFSSKITAEGAGTISSESGSMELSSYTP